jgi:DNA replication protein DnaC
VLNDPTMQKLKGLRLPAFAAAWLEQQKNPDMTRVAFDERLGYLVDAECLARENARLARLLRDAKLKIPTACIEGVDYSAKRELDRAVVRQLASCRWIAEHHNLCISGATGTGKTFLACAFAQQACRHGYRTLYRRSSRFFEELRLAQADGSHGRLLARIARIDVLVLDDWGLSPVTERERRDFHEVLEDRHGERSTIITSQLPPDRFHDHLGDPMTADAICDRLLHNAHRIALKGPSRRRPEKP